MVFLCPKLEQILRAGCRLVVMKLEDHRPYNARVWRLVYEHGEMSRRHGGSPGYGP